MSRSANLALWRPSIREAENEQEPQQPKERTRRCWYHQIDSTSFHPLMADFSSWRTRDPQELHFDRRIR
jgi:hypothetical protein